VCGQPYKTNDLPRPPGNPEHSCIGIRLEDARTVITVGRSDRRSAGRRSRGPALSRFDEEAAAILEYSRAWADLLQ
jgi:hypothetical protein